MSTDEPKSPVEVELPSGPAPHDAPDISTPPEASAVPPVEVEMPSESAQATTTSDHPSDEASSSTGDFQEDKAGKEDIPLSSKDGASVSEPQHEPEAGFEKPKEKREARSNPNESETTTTTQESSGKDNFFVGRDNTQSQLHNHGVLNVLFSHASEIHETRAQQAEEQNEASSGDHAQQWAKDLTEPLNSPDDAIYLIAEDDMEEERCALKQAYLMLLQCEDRNMALNTATRLLDGIGIARDQAHRRKLAFSGSMQRGEGVSLEVLREMLPHSPYDRGIVADLFDRITEAESILAPLIQEEDHPNYFPDIIKEHLSMRRTVLICLVPTRIIEKALMAPDVRIWSIDAVQVLLRGKFPTEHARYYQQFQSQKERGLWGPRGQIYAEFRRALNENRFTDLLSQYSGMTAPMKTKSHEGLADEDIEFNEASSTTDERDTFENDKPFDGLFNEVESYREVCLAVLYTAYHFHDVSVADFQRLVDVFLGDRMGEAYREETYKDNDGEMQIHQVAYQVPLVQAWHDNPRDILRQCQLISPLSEADGQRVIVFQEPHLYKKARQFIAADPFYEPKRFADIQQAGLLFDDSSRILRNVVQLSILMAIEHREEYGVPWLVDWVMGAERHFLGSLP